MFFDVKAQAFEDLRTDLAGIKPADIDCDPNLKKLNQFVLLDLERDIRTTALAEGQDDVKTLMELVELSKRRKQFNL